MTDLDSLRAALHEPPAEPLGLPDLGQIMAKGKRIRRRRRLAVGGGGVAAAALVVAVVFGASQLRQPAANDAAAPPPAPMASPTSPSSLPDQSNQPVGDVMPTGLKDSVGEVVFYAVEVNLPEQLPGIHFGVVAGHRTPDGKLTAELECNEVKGADRSTGFHCLDGGETSSKGTYIPVFGYYAGPAAKITTTAHGKTVTASLKRWSEDKQVAFFWFDPVLVESSNVLTPPIAYDAAGVRLTK